MTITWSDDDLTRIGAATELELASRRADGTLTPYVTMWVVRARDDLYLRSAGGPDRPWYRRARESGNGRIRAAGIERDVDFAEPRGQVHAGIDTQYHAKYDRYGATTVGHVTGPQAESVTIRLVPTKEIAR